MLFVTSHFWLKQVAVTQYILALIKYFPDFSGMLNIALPEATLEILFWII